MAKFGSEQSRKDSPRQGVAVKGWDPLVSWGGLEKIPCAPPPGGELLQQQQRVEFYEQRGAWLT